MKSRVDWAALGAAEEPPDPGWYVSSEELNDYSGRVNKLIGEMSEGLKNMAPMPSGAVPLLPEWTSFTVEWGVYLKGLHDSWFPSGSEWSKIREYHKRALDFKERFERVGARFELVSVTPVPTAPPAPGERRVPVSAPAVPGAQASSAPVSPEELGGKSGGVSAGWYVAGGALLLLGGLVLGSRR